MSCLTYLLELLVFSKLSEPGRTDTELVSWCLQPVSVADSALGAALPLPQNCKPETAPSINVLKFMQLSCTLLTAHLSTDSRHCHGISSFMPIDVSCFHLN